MKKISQLILTSSLIGLAASAAFSEVNVYSSRQEALIKPLLTTFTEQTGIKVNLVSGKDDALITRLTTEGKRSPADLLITADAGRLYRAKQADVLQPINSAIVDEKVPSNLRDVDDLWTGLTMRARPIFYVKDKVTAEQLTTYEALTDLQWKAKICIRSSSNIYNQSLIASMIDHEGASATENFAKGLVANFARPPSGGDTDQLKAAAAGLCDIAIANTYYYGRLVNSDDASDNEVASKLAVYWPNQNDRGVHVNVSGVAITKASKNVQEAKLLIEFMLNTESQQWYSEVNNEYPVVEGVAASKALTDLGTFKADALNLTVLGENNEAAVKLMDRAGWK
jgi:iron(III) transport system substrate-binding protein